MSETYLIASPRPLQGLSLEQAIKEKYWCQETEGESGVDESALGYKPGAVTYQLAKSQPLTSVVVAIQVVGPFRS
jgi:hypothetical protein